jgi:glycosyltransferase involved in cell wall biosynthesis
MPPLVSVLIPVYNARRYVRDAIESVQAQTFEDWEAIVVDDGSADGGGLVAREMAANDKRVRVHEQENAGPAAARNAALRLASGEFVAFLDADDLWLPGKLERQLSFWREGLVYSDAYIIDSSGTRGRIGAHAPFARGEVFETLVERNFVPTLTVLVPRQLVVDNGCFNESRRMLRCDDYDLWLRLAAAGIPFDYLPEPLASYRVHDANLTADAADNAADWVAVLEGLATTIGGPRAAMLGVRAARARRDLAGSLRQRAWQQATAGCTADARADLLAAQAASPSFPGALATALAIRSGLVLRALARWRLASAERPSH